MFRKLIYLMFVVLVLGLAHSGWGTTKIIIVTNNPGDEADYTPFLRNLLGYDVSVEAEDDKYIDPLDAAAKADLEAADLVIVSRRTSSGNFSAEVDFWNGLATPMILHSAFLLGDDRWRWMPGGNAEAGIITHVAVVDESSLIFDGVTITDGQVEIVSPPVTGLDVSNQDSAGNGTKIATPVGSNRVMIARWDAGAEYYPGSGQIAGGPRIFFGMRTDEFLPFVTDDGKKMLENAILISLGLFGDPAMASEPNPANEVTDVPRDIVLSWQPGEYALPINGHTVYLSESFNNVNDGIGGTTQDANSYARPQRLDFSTTYYWRVDEVNAPPDSAVHQGSVWSFTTEPIAYAIENITATASSSEANKGPENTINGSGLDANDLHSTETADMWLSNDEPNGAWIEYEIDKVHKLHEMWVWNSNDSLEPMFGLGCKDVSIEYSVNGTDYTTLAGVPEFAQASGTPDYAHNTTVDLSGVTAKYVRLTANGNWGGFFDKYGLSEVRFFSIPIQAREPSPDSGATDVDVDVNLGFRAGREAAEHHLYFSSDEQAVIDGNAPVTTVAETSYGPLSLDLGTTYYWKINEVNEAETTTTWQGDIWSFSTREFFIVDDFEDYNDYPPDEIWATWVDGYGVPANGATAGYPEPDWFQDEHYAETTTVHGGEQAMPLFYSNTGTATYSEGERTFAVPQNWTAASVQTLTLYFHGTPGNTGQLYVKINDTKVPYDDNATDITKIRWKQWNIDLASLGVDLQSVATLTIGIDGSGASGTLYFDDIRLYRLAPEPPVEVYLEAEAATPLGASWRTYIEPASSGGQHIGSEDGDGNDGDTAPGAEWVATYNFTVSGGTYTVVVRAQDIGDDSFWIRIPSAASQTHEDPDQPGTGWVLNDIGSPEGVWEWEKVQSDDHDDAVVNWTLPAGANTLEIAKREDGVLLDAILITSDVD